MSDALRLIGKLNMRYEDLIDDRPPADPEEIKNNIKEKLRKLEK